jgi:hypothetical protein
MNIVKMGLAAIVSGSLASGCSTDLTVVAANSSKPEVGVLYYLPVGVIRSSVTQVLSGCPKRASPELDVVSSIEASAIYLADPSQSYLVPYTSMNSPFKKTSFAATMYENGTLKSINLAIQDKTSAVLANLGKTAINVARMVVGVPPVPTATLVEKDWCNEKTRVALDKSAEVKGNLKRLRELLLTTPINDRPKIENDIATAEKELAKYQQQLTSVSIYQQKPSFEQRPDWADALEPSADILRRWLSDEGFELYHKQLITRLTIWSEVHAMVASAAPSAGEAGTSTSSALGYRQPGPVVAVFCRRDEPKTSCAAKDAESVVARASFLLPQAGTLSYLALHNGPFDNNTLSAEFSASGTLLSFAYLSEAQLEAATAALATASGSAGGVLGATRSADAVRLQQEVDEEKLKNELLKLKQERAALLSADETQVP